MGRVYLTREESVALLEAIHNVEDTCGPLEQRQQLVYNNAAAKLRMYGHPPSSLRRSKKKADGRQLDFTVDVESFYRP
jgi:hypothetical protein